MNRNGIKAQMLCQDWQDGKEQVCQHIDGLLSRIERGELGHSLSAAVSWYNRFARCSEAGLRDYLSRVPQWIIAEL